MANFKFSTLANRKARPRLLALTIQLAALAFVGLIIPIQTVAAAERACGAVLLASGIAERVLDPQTILLADGRAIRLAGIALPTSSAGPEGFPQGGPNVPAAVEKAIVGQEVLLRADAVAPDRYGRLRAYASLKHEGLERSLQHDMLALGLALVAPRVGAPDCFKELHALERAARAARIGIWADTRLVRTAEQAKELSAERGRLMLVEGRVLSVRESGGTIYVNFGRRWSEDFTVTIPKRSERSFIAAGLAPKVLESRRVRVRGFVEERGGPWIEARYPEQIELLQD